MKRKDIALALIRYEEKIFLVKRKFEPFKHFWAFHGGRLSYNETIERGAMRETKEGTGFFEKYVKEKGLTIVHVFLCKPFSVEYNIDKEESSDGGWFSVDEALDSNFKLVP